MENGQPRILESPAGEPLTEAAKAFEQAKQDSELYLDTRKSYNAAETGAEELYDKWLLTLAGGALGLSMTFLKDVSSHGVVRLAGVLFAAWICFGLSIVCILSNLRLTPHLNARYRTILDRRFSPTKYDPAKNNWDIVQRKQSKVGWTVAVDILNWASLAFFFCGVVLMALFTLFNMG